MRFQLIRALALSCLVALCTALLMACTAEADQAALEATVDAMQEAGESGNTGDLMEVVAEDFVGKQGQLDRRGLQRLFTALRLRHSDVGVTRVSTDYEISEGFATVKLKLLLTGGSGGLLPESGRLLDVDTRWRVEGGEWRVVSAEWDGNYGG